MSKAPVLLVIDAQEGFSDSDYWGSGVNPKALENIKALVEAWREKGLPIVVVKHNSKDPDSPLFPGNGGNRLVDFIHDKGYPVIQKSVNSAFYGTPDLRLLLDRHNHRQLVICGITTNFCCETTARMAGNLGFQTNFVIDATDAFDLVSKDGSVIPGAEVMRMTAANLDGEFASVLTTAEQLAQIS